MENHEEVNGGMGKGSKMITEAESIVFKGRHWDASNSSDR